MITKWTSPRLYVEAPAFAHAIVASENLKSNGMEWNGMGWNAIECNVIYNVEPQSRASTDARCETHGFGSLAVEKPEQNDTARAARDNSKTGENEEKRGGGRRNEEYQEEKHGPERAECRRGAEQAEHPPAPRAAAAALGAPAIKRTRRIRSQKSRALRRLK